MKFSFETQQEYPFLSSLLALQYYCRAEQLKEKKASIVARAKLELQGFQREIESLEPQERTCIEIISQLPLQI
jgi:hypothetical protein